ncbi:MULTISPECIES: O-antigen polysaccharide polymerase Wzy family protein [Butyricimonas]|uniref:O-antigen polysaccharide polymerase Wzy family protein n=1 Tax=Butyricimonas TaxID=574697 RepID=UPI001D08DB98|nr:MULTISPECIES: O-antigen polysaccharide polymerase Wzy family protein [Butyricimonas]MCB6974760.1 O-antigen polysaccharide polymerase Wzy family protein [Butyricimonas synergistica]MCG4521502.1 O-antigen polysaccharide polymerase Wzy family protein [Butyricimonas sp. DFI.6.44]
MIKVDRVKFNTIFRFSLAFSLISIYILAVKDYSVVIILPCMVFLLGMYFCVKNIYNNIFLFSFLICFFTFLLGGQLLDKFINVYGYDFSEDIELHTDLVLLIGLTGLMFGYFLADKTKENRHVFSAVDYNSTYYVNVRTVSKYLFFVSYALWILILLDNILYVVQYGYISYYLSYSSRVPALIRVFGYMAPSAFFLYLATMPAKREAKIVIIMYSFYLLLSLGTGRRIYFMTGILIIFAYMMLRNVVNPERKPWISKKQLIYIGASIPILLMSMYLFEYIRSEHVVGTASAYSPLLGFFVRQGTSINVIKYTELFEARLDPDAYYSLYNTLKWLQDSWIDHLLNLNLNFEFGRQSLETAMSGTYLADFVSYNANPAIYLTGMGYGSCYIEELYVDFGYIGVFLGNVIYGILLCVLLKNAINRGNIWRIAIGLFMIDAIFKAPRATFDAFWGQFLYFNSWGPFLLIFIFVNVYMTKNNRYVR